MQVGKVGTLQLGKACHPELRGHACMADGGSQEGEVSGNLDRPLIVIRSNARSYRELIFQFP